ncbi:MAG: sigma-70 family RNA polymerase sigma factor [Verrucomicrobia bacterium]|nr:sigma-70 family RNA polymerase sigma factor [Verrucomicrobiota bacterium]
MRIGGRCVLAAMMPLHWTQRQFNVRVLRSASEPATRACRGLDDRPRQSGLPASEESVTKLRPCSSATPSATSAWSWGEMTINVEQDIRLLQRVALGETEALSELYDRFSGTLLGLAWKMLGAEEEAEEVLQEVFLKVWEKADRYDPKLGSPIAWLVTMARNLSHDRLRASARRSRLLDSLKQEEGLFGDAPQLPTQGLLTEEAAVQVRLALQKIPSEQRRAIELAFVGGLSQTEIAEHLNEPLGTVKARIRRGMLAMREAIPMEWRPDAGASGN